MKEIAVFTFDAEARGYSPQRHGLVAVGITVGDVHGNILEKRRWHIKALPDQDFEPRCKEQFWNHHADVLQILSTNQVSAGVFATELRKLLDQYHRTHVLYLLCDNPALDVKFIDHYLDVHGNYPGLQYDTSDNTVYRAMHDSDSYARGHLGFGFDLQWVRDDKIPGVTLPEKLTTHLPDDDAEKIYRVHCQVLALARSHQVAPADTIKEN